MKHLNYSNIKKEKKKKKAEWLYEEINFVCPDQPANSNKQNIHKLRTTVKTTNIYRTSQWWEQSMWSASEKYRRRNRSDESRDGRGGGGEDGGVRLFSGGDGRRGSGLRAEGGIDKIGRTLGFLHPYCSKLRCPSPRCSLLTTLKAQLNTLLA